MGSCNFILTHYFCIECKQLVSKDRTRNMYILWTPFMFQHQDGYMSSLHVRLLMLTENNNNKDKDK